MKVFVSVPDPIFHSAEHLARTLNISRSKLYAQALDEYVTKHSSDAVTAKLDEVYGTAESGLDEPFFQAQFVRLKD